MFERTAVSRPRDITLGSDGALWFTNQGALLYPELGRPDRAHRRRERCRSYQANGLEGAFAITVGPGKTLWFTSSKAQTIGEVTTAGAVTMHTVTTGPLGIVLAADGALWFTSKGDDSIGRIGTDGRIRTFTDPDTTGNCCVPHPRGSCRELVEFASELSDALLGKGDTDMQAAADAMQKFAGQAPTRSSATGFKIAFQNLACSKIANALQGVDLSSGQTPSAAVIAKLAKLSHAIDSTKLAPATPNLVAPGRRTCRRNSARDNWPEPEVASTSPGASDCRAGGWRAEPWRATAWRGRPASSTSSTDDRRRRWIGDMGALQRWRLSIVEFAPPRLVAFAIARVYASTWRGSATRRRSVRRSPGSARARQRDARRSR